MRTFTDKRGNPVVYVFASPGRFWKDRWVAFTSGNEFVYFKGSRDEAMKWANDYASKQ